MGWETRSYGPQSDGGGFGRGLRRMFESDNPLSWSLPLYTAWGIRVRIHLIFVIMIVVDLVRSLARDRIGIEWTAMGLGSLFVLVLLHEYGHCIACRWVGGEADQILMWPLGGLASCYPPHQWKADLITTVGGPAVNAALWPVLGAALAAALPAGERWEALVFNPFNPGAAMPLAATWVQMLWWVYYVNAVLFLFNVLLVMYPMDSGRIVRDLLWIRLGYQRSTMILATVGLVVAAVLFVVGITGQSGVLVGIAAFGGITCWMERRRMQMAADPVLGAYDHERGFTGPMLRDRGAGAEERVRKAAEKKRKEREREQAELDRILAKIASGGMASLSGAEKKWLRRTTEKKRAE